MTYMYDDRGYGSYTKGNNHFVGLTTCIQHYLNTIWIICNEWEAPIVFTLTSEAQKLDYIL